MDVLDVVAHLVPDQERDAGLALRPELRHQAVRLVGADEDRLVAAAVGGALAGVEAVAVHGRHPRHEAQVDGGDLVGARTDEAPPGGDRVVPGARHDGAQAQGGRRGAALVGGEALPRYRRDLRRIAREARRRKPGCGCRECDHGDALADALPHAATLHAYQLRLIPSLQGRLGSAHGLLVNVSQVCMLPLS